MSEISRTREAFRFPNSKIGLNFYDTFSWPKQSNNLEQEEYKHIALVFNFITFNSTTSAHNFYRTQVYLGSDLWVQVSVTPCLVDLTDVTLVDEDTNSILADDTNRAIPGDLGMQVAPNFRISTKFQDFEQISEFQPNFSILTKFQDFD